MKKLLSMTLSEIYLDYLNNFITILGMANYYEVDLKEMVNLLEISNKFYKEIYN